MTRDEQWVLEEKYGGTPGIAFEEDRRRLASGEPAAYVIGHQPFLGLKIYLDSRPLIPRPETEWWVDQLLMELEGDAISGTPHRSTGRAGRNFSAEKYSVPRNRISEKLSLLDLCAGSGAIGCAALARLPNAQVYFGEIDPAHETTIRKNVFENDLDASRAHIGIGDLFEPFGDMKFDVIAANPPYIPAARELPRSVSAYEPAQALYAGEDGLAVVRRIAAELPHRLNPGGVAWIECDSAHAAAACALFADRGLSAEVLHDQYDAPRVVRVSPP